MGFPEAASGLLVTALAQVEFAKMGQGVGLADRVADLTADAKRLLKVGGCLVVAFQHEISDSDVAQCAGFTGPVANLPIQRQRLLQVTGGWLVHALPPASGAEVDQCF